MKSKTNRGRPRLDETLYKGQIIQVRMTSTETHQILDHCKRENISISTLLRNSIKQIISR